MKRPYVVLGCGPAGLLAAHALELAGREWFIMSQRLKSVLGGAQFCHVAIPDVTDEEPEAMLTYRVLGTAPVYQSKVYGSAPVPFVSFNGVAEGKQVPAWSLRDIYDQLWDRYSERVVSADLNWETVLKLKNVFNVVSSVPANAICDGTHTFRSQTVLIANDVLPPQEKYIDDNTIVYDGTETAAYYRASKIFGVTSTEWGPSAAIPADVSPRQVRKPISMTCLCHVDVIRVGRYGTWAKGVLTHHGFQDLLARLDAGDLQ